MTDLEQMAAVRAVHIASALAVAGAFLFRLLVLPRPAPAASGTADGSDAPAATAARWAATWCGAALVVAVASWLAWLALTAASMSGTPLAVAIDGDVLGIVLVRTTFGHVWIVRAACMLTLAVCLVVARRRFRARSIGVDAIAALFALSQLLTIAATGHAIAGEPAQRAVRLSIDALHLLGAGAWLGALVPLLFVLARSAADASSAWHVLSVQAVRRFSALGVLAVVVLLGSGLANAVWLVGSWTALVGTPYGHLVAVKVFLFAVILAIAAVNRVRWTPLLQVPSAQHRALLALRRNAIAELAIGVVVVCVVGFLGVTPPPMHEHMGAMGSAR